jgi:hypothetical protein
MSHFGVDNTKADGLRTRCKTCTLLAARERRKEDPYTLFCNQSRDRAKRKGLKHTITAEDIMAVDNEMCPYLHIPISWGQGRGARQDDSKSLDRIDSSKGYTPDNIIICSWRANRLLSDFTAEELLVAAASFFKVLNYTNANTAADRRF